MNDTSTGILTVDLGAIQANWRLVCSRLNSQASASAVIKANAYGLGAAQVGPALYRVGCREFFVATLEEGLAARPYLPPDAEIYVLGGARPGAEETFLTERLRPVLSTLTAVRRWQSACLSARKAGCSAIKIDTGMARLGLSGAEWHQLKAEPETLLGCNPVLFMSHLACADELGHPANKSQLQAFQSYCAEVKNLIPAIRCSLANSSGIFLGSAWHFDQVRPGASLYGVNPRPESNNPMKPVVQLDLPVLQLRRLETSAGIGYGHTIQAAADTHLAVVAGGYADGLNRTIGRQKAQGYFQDHLVSVVGRISMDTTIFDLGDMSLPDDEAGQYIRVLGDDLTVDVMQQRTRALGYEVLTSLGSRYQRRYLRADVDE